MTMIEDLYREHLPGYAEVVDQTQRFVARRGELIQPSTGRSGRIETRQSKATQVVIDALTGDNRVDLDDVRARIADVLREEEIGQLLGEAMRDGQDWLRTQRASIIAAGSDRLLAALSDRVAALVDEGRRLAPIRQIVTAEAAQASRRLDDGQRLADLRATYGLLVREYVRILREAAENYSSQKRLPATFLRDAHDGVEAFPDLMLWVQYGYRTHRRRNEDQYFTPPWPDPVTQSGDFLLWSLEHDVVPWVAPSLATLQQAVDLLGDASHQPRANDPASDWVDPANLTKRAMR